MTDIIPPKKKARVSQKKRLQLKNAAGKPKPVKRAEPRPEGQGQSRTAHRRRMKHAYKEVKEELEDADLRARLLRVGANTFETVAPMETDTSILTQTPPSAQPPRLATPPTSTPARSSPHPYAPTSMPTAISSALSHMAIRAEMRKRKRKSPQNDKERCDRYLQSASTLRREDEMRSMAEEAEAYKRQATLHKGRADVLQGETASLKILNGQLQGVVEGLDLQMAALDSQHTQLKDQHRALKQQTDTLREHNAQLQGRTVELEQKTGNLQQQNTQLESRACDLEKQTGTLHQQNTQLESRSRDLEQQTGVMQEANIQLQLRNETLQKTVDDLRDIGEQHAYESKEKEKFKIEVERLRELINTLQNRVKDLEAKDKEHVNRSQLCKQKTYLEEKLADGVRHVRRALSKDGSGPDGKLKAWVDDFVDSGEVEQKVGVLSSRSIRDVAKIRDDQNAQEKVAAMRRTRVPVMTRGSEDQLQWADQYHDAEFPDEDMLEAERSSQAALNSSQRSGGA